MWAKLNSARDTIEEIIVNTKQMSINEVTHPETLFTLWTDLKTIDKNAVAASAHTWLTGFAWLIERKVTANIAIPNAVITYMASIRQDCDDIQSAIDGAANVDALAGLDTDSWTSDANVKAYRR